MTTKPRTCPKANVRPHAEAANRNWHAISPSDHTLSEALWPGYLGSRVKDMRVGDTFDIRHEEHHFIVKGYVLDVDVDASMLSFITLEVIDLRDIDPVAYDWADVQVARQQGGWAILRDGHPLKDGFATEAAANEWLATKRAMVLAGGKVTS